MSELPSKYFVTDLLFEILKWKLPSFEINENFTTVLDFINSSDHYFTEKKNVFRNFCSPAILCRNWTRTPCMKYLLKNQKILTYHRLTSDIIVNELFNQEIFLLPHLVCSYCPLRYRKCSLNSRTFLQAHIYIHIYS